MNKSDVHILVVDDDPQMRVALEKCLTMEGFRVDVADKAKEGLAMAVDDYFHCIISDIRMDGLSGMDLLKSVKEKFPETQVIMMTAYGSINTAIEAMKIGAADFLLKPFSGEDLVRVLERVLQHEDDKRTHDFKPEERVRIITESPKMKEALTLAKQVANSRASILIQAESGTGKELLARYIHENSPRSHHPYIAVNCAAVPKELLESELFGHEKGAFTGAISRKIGRFEMAHSGTLVLDEIGEMDPSLQAKILRTLQEQEVDRVGGCRPVSIDVRIIATTNQDIPELIREEKFREDLYYRLNVIPMWLPPLRERPEDIKPLAQYFCMKYGTENGRANLALSSATYEMLTRYDWPGNVRELENIVHRAVVVTDSDEIKPQHLFLDTQLQRSRGRFEIRAGISMKETEKQLILKTLESTGNNRTHAAKLLGISIKTLRNKLKEYREEEGLSFS